MMQRIERFWPGARVRPRAPLVGAARERRQRRRLWVATTLLGLVIWATLAVHPSSIPGLRLDQPSPVSLQADQTITFKSKALTDQARLRAQSSAAAIVYRTDATILIDQRVQLANLLQTITQLRDDPSLSRADRLARLTSLPNSSVVISSTLAARLERMPAPQWQRISQSTLELYDRAVREKSYEVSAEALADLRAQALPYWAALVVPSEDRDLALLFSAAFLKSNQIVDDQATALRKQQAVDAVEPVMVTIQRGESIVRQGDVVTPLIQEKLEALGQLQGTVNWLLIGGQGLIAALLAIIFGGFLAYRGREIWMHTRPLLTGYGLVALTAVGARLWLPIGEDWSYALPLATTVVLLATLFDRGVALLAASLLSLLVGLLSDQQFALGATLLIGCVASLLPANKPARSLNFLFAGMAAALATGLCRLSLLLMVYGGPDRNHLLMTPIAGMLGGALTAILSLGLYNIVGHLAGIITPVQLMELAHPSQPLLRRLMREAPGTYYHSIAVGNLAESAAELVGADALLLRVAAYYHDIGKIIRPYFFTDNQSDRENVHNDLDPHTSAQIIADHVREGLKMARAAGLPPQLTDFIATHHGTMVIKHFYQLAMQQQDSVNLEDYRYPGPRPQTREQGILMLADSVEATVRSKAQHGQIVSARDSMANGRSPGGKQTLEELVTAIIDERLRSGQLDESALTIQDLTGIRQAFINTLQGIYHPRVEYAPQVVHIP